MIYVADQRADPARPADDGGDRDPAELPGAGLGVRRTAGGRAADGGRRCGDPRLDVGAAPDHVRHRRVDLRAEPHHRAGAGAGDRLHAADHQPIPRRARRRRRPRRGAGPHHGDRRPHGAVLGDDRRAVDGGDGAVPDVLPEVVRLRGRRDGRVRRRGGDRGDPRGDRAARGPARRAGHAPAGAPNAAPAASPRASRSSSCSGTARRNSSCAGPFRSASPSSRCCCCSGARSSGVKWGFPDDRVLPQSASAHQVGDQLRNDFADDSSTDGHGR